MYASVCGWLSDPSCARYHTCACVCILTAYISAGVGVNVGRPVAVLLPSVTRDGVQDTRHVRIWGQRSASTRGPHVNVERGSGGAFAADNPRDLRIPWTAGPDCPIGPFPACPRLVVSPSRVFWSFAAEGKRGESP
jgi:hypothetical protein